MGAGSILSLVSGRIWVLTDRRYLGQRMPAALIRRLRSAGHTPGVVVAEEAGPRAWAWLGPSDVVVARSRHEHAPALLDEAQACGARVVDTAREIHGVRDKLDCMRALARAGLPVPATLAVRGPGDLQRLADSALPLVVKPVLGDNSRGVRVLRTRDEADHVDWAAGPHLAQRYLDAAGVDTKLYVAGVNVWATRRTSPLIDPEAAAVRVPVTPELHRIAAGCRRTFGLELFGADVLQTADGAAIVDVNEFPNYTGVREAPAAIAALLADVVELTRADLACAPS